MPTFPSITPLPDPPARTDPANFDTRADAFLDSLTTFQEEVNSLVSALNSTSASDTFLCDNQTGGIIGAYVAVKLVGDSGGVPRIAPITQTSDTVLGLVTESVANNNTTALLLKGRVVASTLDTSASTLGATVYVTSAGALTLTETKRAVGIVIGLATSGIIYFNPRISVIAGAVREGLVSFGGEPGAVGTSTSGTAGVAETVSRSDHAHDLSTHAHTGATNGGTIDHGTVTGLSDDDHTQYLLANGTRALTGTLSCPNAPTDGQHLTNRDYVDGVIAANDAMVYKGAVDCSASPNYPAADRGHTYRVSVAGKIGGASGASVEIGDMLLCLTDGTVAGTQAAVGANWNIIQVNIDGGVRGPVSAVDSNLAVYDGTTGKLIKDSGISLGSLTAGMARAKALSSFSASSNTIYECQAPAIGMTGTLPASPSDLVQIEFWDVDRVASTRNITVARNGKTINGLAEDFVLDFDGACVGLSFNADDNDWFIYKLEG